MVKYPAITSQDFYKKINAIYSPYKAPKNNKTLEEICYPKQFKLQLPQMFLAEFINPATPYMGILVYHRIGSGKTCTAIRIAEKWKKQKRIIVVVPASLKGNFRTELRSMCVGNDYLKANERTQLSKLHPQSKEYKEIIELSDERIDKIYEIYSYNKFIDLLNSNSLNLRNALLIVDEIQNMVSENGNFYRTLYEAIHGAPQNLRVVLLSATPMFDKPHEIGLTLNLLKPLSSQFPISNAFNNHFIHATKKRDGTLSYSLKNIDEFKQLAKGYISFFRGAPPISFPHMTIKYTLCEMGPFQYKAYLKVAGNELQAYASATHRPTTSINRTLDVSDLPNNFFIGSRMISNVVYPNNKINANGFEAFTKTLILKDLQRYSIKFSLIMQKLESTRGKTFVYSGFKMYGGIKSFTKVLDAYGYKDYTQHGIGPKRYAVWSGDEDMKTKEEIKTIFNRKDNITGKNIRILIGSISISTGVSLTAVRAVHVLEPYWNQSRLEQVIGRASRFCSHMSLPEEKRNVKVYIYIAVAPGFHDNLNSNNNNNNKNKKIKPTIDYHIHKLAEEKQKLVTKFENVVKEVAVDCYLNKRANVYEGENDIKCEV